MVAHSICMTISKALDNTPIISSLSNCVTSYLSGSSSVAFGQASTLANSPRSFLHVGLVFHLQLPQVDKRYSDFEDSARSTHLTAPTGCKAPNSGVPSSYFTCHNHFDPRGITSGLYSPSEAPSKSIDECWGHSPSQLIRLTRSLLYHLKLQKHSSPGQESN